jgi:hypothetical protein
MGVINGATGRDSSTRPCRKGGEVIGGDISQGIITIGWSGKGTSGTSISRLIAKNTGMGTHFMQGGGSTITGPENKVATDRQKQWPMFVFHK